MAADGTLGKFLEYNEKCDFPLFSSPKFKLKIRFFKQAQHVPKLNKNLTFLKENLPFLDEKIA